MRWVDDRKDICLTLGGLISAKGGLGRIISEKILKLKGLLSLTDHYQEVHSY
ncbi:hypothetical protein HMPREF9430_00768 [Solobacterium moorei F0204]|uniref:Uncharacterized protein n=1 Tax=Solobacterium moorei F0204 TaxID=706433 RepID=E7MMK1_9FIRM|nr:hypothetical protein HMPREF9430_00768 [Solobacterium moorei F0204]